MWHKQVTAELLHGSKTIAIQEISTALGLIFLEPLGSKCISLIYTTKSQKS